MKCNFDDASPIGEDKREGEGGGGGGGGGTPGLAVNIMGEGRHAPPNFYSRKLVSFLLNQSSS